MQTCEKQVVEFYNKIVELNHKRKNNNNAHLLEEAYLQLLHLSIFSLENATLNEELIEKEIEFTLLDYLVAETDNQLDGILGMLEIYGPLGSEVCEHQIKTWKDLYLNKDMSTLNHGIYNQVRIRRNQLIKEREGQSKNEIIENHCSSEMKEKSFLEKTYLFTLLKNVNREGWIKRNVELEYQENNVEHAMQMVFLAYATYLTTPDFCQSFSNLIRGIVIHDTGEIIIGDIPERTVEHESKLEKEKIAIQKVFSPFAVKNKLYDLWLEKEEKSTDEGLSIHQLDKLDAVLKAKWLDNNLNRSDLFNDFYQYEEQRATFDNSKFDGIFKSLILPSETVSSLEKKPKQLV